MIQVQPLPISELLYDEIVRPDGTTLFSPKNDISLALNLDADKASKEVLDTLTQAVSAKSVDGMDASEAAKVDNVFDAVNIMETRFVQSPADKVRALQLLEQRVTNETKRLQNADEQQKLLERYNEFLAKV